jgi:hypothetical protein
MGWVVSGGIGKELEHAAAKSERGKIQLLLQDDAPATLRV